MMLGKTRKWLTNAALALAEGDPKALRRLARHAMSTRRALIRLHDAGIAVASVIDVGASDGRWSVMAAEIWPSARFHLVEANPIHGPELNRLCAGREGFSHVLAAAGDEDGEIWFDAADPFGGVASHERQEGMVALPVTRLARQAELAGLVAPYLIKLDTHGFEVPILEGAASLLPQASVLVIEAYNFTLGDGALRFWEMCAYLSERGFRVIDIAEPGWRPADHAFWQADFIFLRDDAPPFRSNAFRR